MEKKSKEEIVYQYRNEDVDVDLILKMMQEYSDQENAELKEEMYHLNGMIKKANSLSSALIQDNKVLKSKADELYEALDECRLQLEYLNGKFKETGTTNAVLSQSKQALENYKK